MQDAIDSKRNFLNDITCMFNTALLIRLFASTSQGLLYVTFKLQLNLLGNHYNRINGETYLTRTHMSNKMLLFSYCHRRVQWGNSQSGSDGLIWPCTACVTTGTPDPDGQLQCLPRDWDTANLWLFNVVPQACSYPDRLQRTYSNSKTDIENIPK